MTLLGKVVTKWSWQTSLWDSNATSKRFWSPLCVHKICMWLESSRQNLILLTFSSLPYILYPGGIPIYTSCTLIQKSVERIILLVQVLRLYHVWMTQFLYLYTLQKKKRKVGVIRSSYTTYIITVRIYLGCLPTSNAELLLLNQT